MNTKIDKSAMLHTSRGQVYLLWAVICAIGFVATHYVQRKQINGFWLLLSVVGLGYMLKVMPLGVRQMRNIYLAWLVPITFGMVMSALAFQLDSLVQLSGYLGSFWLAVMAVGFLWNGLVDPPSGWYWVAVGLNVTAALLCWRVEWFLINQYLVAAVVSTWSMLNLWLFRS